MAFKLMTNNGVDEESSIVSDYQDSITKIVVRKYADGRPTEYIVENTEDVVVFLNGLITKIQAK